MTRSLLRRYLEILLEATSFSSLQDAGNEYSLGKTQIWYWKENFGHLMLKGYEYLEKENRLPDPNNLSATHVLIGNVAETDPAKIFSMMQAEVWSSQNEANSMIDKLGVGHTSMDTGDIIVTEKQILFVDRKGFVDLTSGENTNVAQ